MLCAVEDSAQLHYVGQIEGEKLACQLVAKNAKYYLLSDSKGLGVKSKRKLGLVAGSMVVYSEFLGTHNMRLGQAFPRGPARALADGRGSHHALQRT
jgi:hypothetical protein